MSDSPWTNIFMLSATYQGLLGSRTLGIREGALNCLSSLTKARLMLVENNLDTNMLFKNRTMKIYFKTCKIHGMGDVEI